MIDDDMKHRAVTEVLAIVKRKLEAAIAEDAANESIRAARTRFPQCLGPATRAGGLMRFVCREIWAKKVD